MSNTFFLAKRTEGRTRLDISVMIAFMDRICGLVVRIPRYRSRGLWFDSRRYQIF
jgi:hypothetical protein